MKKANGYATAAMQLCLLGGVGLFLCTFLLPDPVWRQRALYGFGALFTVFLLLTAGAYAFGWRAYGRVLQRAIAQDGTALFALLTFVPYSAGALLYLAYRVVTGAVYAILLLVYAAVYAVFSLLSAPVRLWRCRASA